MSMHEIEDLIEESVRLLAASEWCNELDLRSMFWQLYEFQYFFDCSFIEFRVRDLLVEQRYWYRFELTAHPDYERYREFFDNLKPDAIDSIGSDPSRPVASGYRDRITKEWIEANSLAGYVQPPFLYCEVGSLLWERFVKLRVLTGRDAEPANHKVRLLDAALAAVKAAEQTNNVALIATWHVILLVKLSMMDLDTLLDDKAFLEFLDVVKRTHAHNVIPPRLMELYYQMPPSPDDPAQYVEQLKQWQIADEDL